MNDRDQNYRTMALNTLRLLTERRTEWEVKYARMLPDYQALGAALAAVDAKAQQRSAVGTEGYTEAKDAAEDAALDAAERVLHGVRALQLDAPRPELAAVADYTRSGLDKMRDLALVAALEGLDSTVQPLAAELAEEEVTAAELTALTTRTAAFKALVGTPRGQAVSGASLRRQVKEHLSDARQALERLDVRMAGLAAQLPDLAAEYRQMRMVVDAGHGPGETGGPRP